MLGPKDIQQECRETTQRSQEAEGSNDPQEQHRLRIHAEICRENQIFRAPSKKSPLAGAGGGSLSPSAKVLGGQRVLDRAVTTPAPG